MSKIPVVGGPHCGLFATPAGDSFRWIDSSGRCYRKPGPGRAYYMRNSMRWIFAGHTHKPCSNCGAIVERPRTVCMCGEGV